MIGLVLLESVGGRAWFMAGRERDLPKISSRAYLLLFEVRNPRQFAFHPYNR
jgi:hypothetical protein